MNDHYPSPFTPEIEALMREVEIERLTREEMARLERWLEDLDAPPLTDSEIARYSKQVAAWIGQAL